MDQPFIAPSRYALFDLHLSYLTRIGGAASQSCAPVGQFTIGELTVGQSRIADIVPGEAILGTILILDGVIIMETFE